MQTRKNLKMLLGAILSAVLATGTGTAIAASVVDAFEAGITPPTIGHGYIKRPGYYESDGYYPEYLGYGFFSVSTVQHYDWRKRKGYYDSDGYENVKFMDARSFRSSPTKVRMEIGAAIRSLKGVAVRISYSHPVFAQITADGKSEIVIEAEATIESCGRDNFIKIRKPEMNDPIESLVAALTEVKVRPYTRCRLVARELIPYALPLYTGGDGGDGLRFPADVAMDYIVTSDASMTLQQVSETGTAPITLKKVTGVAADPQAFVVAKKQAVEFVKFLEAYGKLIQRQNMTAAADAPADVTKKPMDPVSAETKNKALEAFLEANRAMVDKTFDVMNDTLPKMSFDQKILIGRKITEAYSLVHALEDKINSPYRVDNKVEETFLADEY